MVVGVWELVLFLWSHPIISCMFLLLFSPPFYPVIVYFSPLLVCTGLVAVAMISMNMGGRAEEREGLQNGTRGRLHEPTVHHHMEFAVKPPRESWLEWLKKKEEKAKAWVDSRFLTQDKWQFRNISGLAPEEEESMAVDSDNHEGYRIPSYRGLSHATPVRPADVRLAPILTRRDIRPPQGDYEVFAPLAEDDKVSNDRSNSSVPEAEEIKPIPHVEVPVEERPFAFSNLEHRSVPSLMVPLAAAEEESPAVQTVPSVVIPSASKAERKIEEPPIADVRSEPDSLVERVTEVPVVLLQEEVLPLIDTESCFIKVPRENGDSLVKEHEGIAENPGLITSAEANALISDNDRVTKVGALLVGIGAASCDRGIPVSLEAGQSDVNEARNVETSSDLYGSMPRSMEVLASPELIVSGEDRRASPEAEEASVSSKRNEPDILRLAAPESFSAGEKIIFVDEPSKFTTVQSGSMVAEAMETLSIQKSIGQMVVFEPEPRKSDFEGQKDRSPEDGLDDNIELCGDVPPIPTSTASAVLLQNSEPMAVGRSSVSEGSSTESKALVQVLPQPDDLEWMMSSIYNDVALTTPRRMLDKSYSLNSTFTVGEEYDDLTARFYALKKSMSFHTTRSWEEPISLGTADETNSIVPVYIPETVTRVEKDPFSQDQDVPEEKPRPRLSSADMESVESITARLLTKFTPNLASNRIFSQPPSRPAPALPTKAPVSVESDKSMKIAPPTSVESDESVVVSKSVQSDKGGEVAENLVHPIDLPAVKITSHSKKSLTSFLSRRRERMISSPEAFSNSVEGEGENGLTIGSGMADTVTSVENRDDGSTTTTSGRRRKGKMISPLKRVFTMDATAGSGRKGGSRRASSLTSSPVRERPSVIDRSKDKFMKLFSLEGGLTKVEQAEVGKLAIPATPELATSAEGHGTDNLEIDSKIGVPLAEIGEELISKSAPLPSSAPSEEAMPPSLDSGEPDGLANVKGNKVTKSSSGKKFLWSWTKKDDKSLLATPESAPSGECHEIADVGLDSEKQLLPGSEALSFPDSGELISKSEFLLPSVPSEKSMPPPTLDEGEPEALDSVRENRANKSSSEKKFAWSWTKKKRCSDPQNLPVDQLMSPNRSVSWSGKGIDEESRVILMSPLTRFHSSSAIMSPVDENAQTGDQWDEYHSSEFRFSGPDSKADSLSYKRSPISWWSPKTDLPTAEKKEKVGKVEKDEKAAQPPKLKKASTFWWSRRHSRADSKAVPSSSPDLPPTDISSTSNITDSAASIEKSGPITRDDYFSENPIRRRRNDRLPDNDEVAAIGPLPWHRRERSESLPARAKFSRFHARQMSLSDFTFPRTPELSPASSSGRATDYNNGSIGTSSTSVSMPRTDEDNHQEHVKEKRKNDPSDSNSGTKSSNVRWRTNSAILPIRPSSVRTLDLANEQLRGSLFHRSDLDVNSRLYRNSPSGAEIRITDKLKVPLEEVLSLLSTGDSDDQHPLTTADEKTTGSSAGGDHRRASSSSSEEETEEEWSATSEDEDELQLQQQQFAPLTAARTRKRLPHYIFNRGEPTAN